MREDRDLATDVTVLTGDIDNNDSADDYGIVASVDWIVGDNSYHVLYASGVNSTAIVDGFTFT